MAEIIIEGFPKPTRMTWLEGLCVQTHRLPNKIHYFPGAHQS